MMRAVALVAVLSLPQACESPVRDRSPATGTKLQDSDWKKENFAGPVPQEIVRSKNGHLELVQILWTRRFRQAGDVMCIAFHPDGRRALSGSTDKTLKLWDLESGKEIATWKGHSHWVASVAISPDGKRALSGSWDKTLKLWDLESGKEIATWKGHSGMVQSVAISPDGKRALSGSWDNTLKLWDLESGKEIDSIVLDGTPIALALRGDLVLAGNLNTTVTVYRLK